MAISPGGEEAGGRLGKQRSFLVQVCVRLLLNHRGSKVHLDCIHHNISVVTNELVSNNAKKKNN